MGKFQAFEKKIDKKISENLVKKLADKNKNETNFEFVRAIDTLKFSKKYCGFRKKKNWK